MALEITTNNVPRDFIYWWDLSAKEQADFDWMANPEETGSFFRYKGEVYDLSDFMHCNIPGWDGVKGDSFFSGIVVRLDEDRIIVGQYMETSKDDLVFVPS